MPEHRIKQISQAFIDYYDQEKLSRPFYIFNQIPPLKIISWTNYFKDLNLYKEEIIFVYDKFKDDGNGFIITNYFVYLLQNYKSQKVELSKFSSAINEEQFVNYLKNTDKKVYSNIYKLILDIENNAVFSVDKNKLEQVQVSKEPKLPLLVNEVFLNTTQIIGKQLQEILSLCNEDKDLINAIQLALNKSNQLKDKFEIKHIIIQDLILIYNKLFNNQNEDNKKSQFVLAYLFEKLQGNDMIEEGSLEKINDMIASDKFSENVNKVKQAVFLKPTGDYEGQLLMPSLLSKLQHLYFDKVATAYHNTAVFLVNTDDHVNDFEKKTLETIHNLCYKPFKKIYGVKQNQVPPNDTLEKVMAELEELIGLKEIKKDIKDLINFLKIQKVREEQGLKNAERMLHAVFMGPPGTGKTTIARLLGRVYKHLGYISSGHLVETDRAGLVAGFVGQTAIKVDEVVQASIGGVLFIDEAYALASQENQRDFGNEAIETLLKRMEDNRDDIVVIAAGYPDNMKTFIQSNPGLQSRFNRYFNFNHYTGQEMLDIYNLIAKKADFKLTDDAQEKLSFIFDGLYEKRNETFGNARVVRNIFEQCIANQANRIVNLKEINKEILMTLEEPDIPEIKETIKKIFLFDEA